MHYSLPSMSDPVYTMMPMSVAVRVYTNSYRDVPIELCNFFPVVQCGGKLPGKVLVVVTCV